MKEYIGIDLGSNSLRCVRMNEEFQVLGEYEETIRTAEGLEKNKIIGEAALSRIIKALKRAKEVLKISQDDEVIALSTQALREAKNRDFILDSIKKVTHITFEVISGEEESFITSLAPQRAILELSQKSLKYKQDCFLLIDMGGASSEFIFCTNKGIFAKSFAIGIVSVKERYETMENFLAHKQKIIEPIGDFIKQNAKEGRVAKFLVANSGTPTSVCAMKLGLKTYDSKKIFAMELQRSDFEEELRKFLLLPKEQRESLWGIFKADVVPFGILLFLSFMEVLGFMEVLVIDEGLREGAVIARVYGKI
ncbi:Ppx/GppA phosphatase family protein [Helicobacter mesocricetorum]|uniref:Ppx/GppA phosphatase family protein n=1 Tax=Helicobacter mesocricetorum TaxID=87012 RepID=UPI000CF0E3EE|nr:phosphatase [Helicobacter mesocricetorum]